MKHRFALQGRPIFHLQTMLRRISDRDCRVLPVIPDGRYGRNTYASVASFQAVSDLPVTGITDQRTWDLIRDANERFPEENTVWPRNLRITFGETDPALFPAQGMLLFLSSYFENLPTVKTTGQLDAATFEALQQLQRSGNLQETGILDDQTWELLQDLYRTIAVTGQDSMPVRR